MSASTVHAEQTTVAVQQKWETIKEIEQQQENAHHEADWNVLTAANRVHEITKSGERHITLLSDNELHKRTVAARNEFFAHCAKTHSFAANRLIPLCEEIIKRYKLPGVAAKDRPNRQPTVDAYFKSIGLNYNTVRSWFLRDKWANREKLTQALFQEPQYRLPEMRIEGDGSLYARSGPDFVKIKRLVEKIVLIADGHNINLRPLATDILISAGQQLAKAHDQPDFGPSAALATVASPKFSK